MQDRYLQRLVLLICKKQIGLESLSYLFLIVCSEYRCALTKRRFRREIGL